jgi:hypothetical protein
MKNVTEIKMLFGMFLILAILCVIFFINDKDNKNIREDSINTKNLSVKYNPVIMLKGR